MEGPSPQVLIGGLLFWALIICLPIFFVILFLLPEDAYGEEDVRVMSKTSIRSRSRTQVLVLGDIGRSPRMQYHALSIAKHGVEVDLIGYHGMLYGSSIAKSRLTATESDVHPDIENHKYITIFPIDESPALLQTSNRMLFMVLGPLKVVIQFFSLWQILGHRTKPAKWLLIQNPPSIPVLAVAALMCWLRKTKLVIDWHNFGYSILALKLGNDHPLVIVSRWYERFWSGSAVANFAVSDAMKRQIKREFGVKQPIVTLHDRPMGNFRPLTKDEKLGFTRRLSVTSPFAPQIATARMRLLVSSTSWTPDEDFQLLLDALVGYSTLAITSHPQLPELLIIITGKGPQREMYLRKIDALKAEDKLEMVTIRTAWLTTEDYARLLGAADLGISLHTSSSGVDLPMKVVDMFGAGLPVIGWGMFEAWPELVQDGVNGRSFGGVNDLRQLLVQLLGPDSSKLDQLRIGAMKERARDWDAEWNRVAAPVFGLSKADIVQPKAPAQI